MILPMSFRPLMRPMKRGNSLSASRLSILAVVVIVRRLDLRRGVLELFIICPSSNDAVNGEGLT